MLSIIWNIHCIKFVLFIELIHTLLAWLCVHKSVLHETDMLVMCSIPFDWFTAVQLITVLFSRAGSFWLVSWIK